MAKKERDLQTIKLKKWKDRSKKKNGRRYKNNRYKCELRKAVHADILYDFTSV
jgi:hypothetical protein